MFQLSSIRNKYNKNTIYHAAEHPNMLPLLDTLTNSGGYLRSFRLTSLMKFQANQNLI